MRKIKGYENRGIYIMISKKTRVLVMGISTILMIGMLTGCSAKSTGVSGANDSEIVASEDTLI